MAQAPEQLAPEQLTPERQAGRPSDGAPAPAWQWARTEQTRNDLLAAAREVFAEQGYTCAKVTDIASRAGLSVGSIYHHFGGKSELYLALWRRYNLAREDAAARAVARARNAGGADAAALWAAGAQAILRTTWKRRDLAALFCAGNGPPDFEDQRHGRPGRPGDALLRISGSSGDPLQAAVLAALLSEGAKAIVAATSHRQAEAIITDILEYGRRLMTASTAPATTAPATTAPATTAPAGRGELPG